METILTNAYTRLDQTSKLFETTKEKSVSKKCHFVLQNDFLESL